VTDWDAATYDRVADPQEEWGREVLGRLELEGDETVLDAGCGSGRLTRHLVERVPNGRVIGVDSSPSMIERARETLGDRAELRLGSLLDLELDREVDAVFSNATFHWVIDHERLFARMHAALRPGGALEAQCGGQGNVAELENALLGLEGDERFAPYLRTLPSPWYFASVADTRARLERAGFEAVRVWTQDSVVKPPEPREFVAASGMSVHLERLPAELREPFLDVLLDSLPRPLELHYVRLNISARRLPE
jgi:trans-aconitate 2-methyltransferase